MKILFCGDVMGRSGRDVITTELPKLKQQLQPSITVVNGENAAGGFGITPKICKQLYEAGADVITTGNHAWDQKEIIPYVETDPYFLRPLNYSNTKTPGRGIATFTLEDGRQVIIIHVMTRLFMKEMLDCPFLAVEEALKTYRLENSSIAAIMIDIHGEANSEKMALAQMFDGRVSFVVGTHTHIPTADCQVLPKGTAYQTDAGMCGDYDSVIGMDKVVPIGRFLGKVGLPRMTPAMGPATLCGTYVEIDDQTGLATHISPVRVGGRLRPEAGGLSLA